MVTFALKKWFLFLVIVFGSGLTVFSDSGLDSSAAKTSRNALRVGVTPNYPPIIFKPRGLISGVEADLANALAKFLNRKVQFIELPWIDQIPALLENKIDIIMSGMSKTKEREVQIAFSVPFYRLGQLPMVRRSSLNKYNTWRSIYFLEGKVGVVKGTTGELIVDRELKKAEKKVFTSGEEAAKALVRRDIDMVVFDAPFLQYLAKDYAKHDVATLSFSPLSEEFLAWGVRKDDSELLEGANRFLREWETNGKLEEVLSKWIPK
jgi:ABC-type amino acid transport substrate-binding protein